MTPWKHREKMVFCRILRFLKNELENCILCTISNFCKKITRIATHLIFFFQWKLKVHTFQKKAPFAYKVDAGALFKEKAPLFFWKNAILRKIEKRRLKRRLLLLWSYGCQESKRRLFFDLELTWFAVKAPFDCWKQEFTKLLGDSWNGYFFPSWEI